MPMEFKKAPGELVDQFWPYSTTNISDALDKLKLQPGIIGIQPMYEGCPKALGSAITMRITAAGPSRPAAHMGVDPIMSAGDGDILVIANAGRLDDNCWGEILTYASLQRKIRGTVIDGACRDVDVIKTLQYPLFARGRVPLTARGRAMQDDYNCLVRIADVQVRPGDIVNGRRQRGGGHTPGERRGCPGREQGNFRAGDGHDRSVEKRSAAG